MLCVTDQWFLGPVFSATKNFRVVIYSHEVGRLTFEWWVFVVNVSPRRSSNTNEFNSHYVVQCSNPVLEIVQQNR